MEMRSDVLADSRYAYGALRTTACRHARMQMYGKRLWVQDTFLHFYAFLYVSAELYPFFPQMSSDIESTALM